MHAEGLARLCAVRPGLLRCAVEAGAQLLERGARNVASCVVRTADRTERVARARVDLGRWRVFFVFTVSNINRGIQQYHVATHETLASARVTVRRGTVR